jgi:Fic family protein
MNYFLLAQKKQRLDGFRPLNSALLKNLEEWFKVELTYTSNAIEGNTLTRKETAVVIEKGLTIGGKTIREHLEANNHAKALDFIQSLVNKKPSEFQQKHLLSIHEIILHGIDDVNAGHYRSIPVRISGSAVVMPNPRKVPDLMDEFFLWLNSQNKMNVVEFAGEAHYRLVTIHPVVDGNGRTARLLMNLLLMMAGYPPAIIRNNDRLKYINALEKAQLGGSKEAYNNIIINAVNRSLDIYLKAVNGEYARDLTENETLLKIGQLAKLAGESVSTIRYWTEQNLLEVAESSEFGYNFYNSIMVRRCQQIKELQKQRLSIKEIKQHFNKPSP